jgi:hypothetical protein
MGTPFHQPCQQLFTFPLLISVLYGLKKNLLFNHVSPQHQDICYDAKLNFFYFFKQKYIPIINITVSVVDGKTTSKIV